MKTKFLLPLVCLFACTMLAGAQDSVAELIKNESSVTYRLVHPLHKIEATSKDVFYRLDLDPATKEIRRVAAQVDVTTFDSGNSNRDSHAMEVIDALTYPDVTFSSTSITRQGDSLRVAGKLTFHGVTRDVVALLTQKWSPNKLEIHGGFDVTLSEFNIDRPSLLLIPVEDKLGFEIAASFALH